MLSKEQADLMSSELLAKARDSNVVKDSVLRRWRNSSANLIFPIIFIPQLFNSWLHQHNEKSNPFYFFVIALFCASWIFTIVVVIYQKRTPLIKIKEGKFLCYGSVPWAKKTFLLSEIDSVIFTKNPIGWRGAYQLSIRVDGVEHRVWLPIGKPSPVPLIQQMFSANFKDKFLESEI